MTPGGRSSVPSGAKVTVLVPAKLPANHRGLVEIE
jgi:hypothetical protein